MTNDGLERAVERLIEYAAMWDRLDHNPQWGSDLRLILAANRKMRTALEHSTVTLQLLKRNVESEIKWHDGLFRWEGVPEATQVSIDQARSALSTKEQPDV